jgi:hypothetical protein
VGLGSRRFVAATIVCAAVMTMSGCSILGLGVGALKDMGTTKTRTVPAERVPRLYPGQSIVLHLRTGEDMRGRFVRFTPGDSVFVLRSESDTLSVPSATIERVDVPYKHSARNLFFVGLMADALIAGVALLVALAASQIN